MKPLSVVLIAICAAHSVHASQNHIVDPSVPITSSPTEQQRILDQSCAMSGVPLNANHLLRLAGAIALLPAFTAPMAQTHDEPATDSTPPKPTWVIDLSPRPNATTSFDTTVSVKTRVKLELSPTLSNLDRKTYNLKPYSADLSTVYTERVRMEAGEADKDAFPVQASLEVLDWKAVEAGQESTAPALPNYRLTGRFNPQSGYDFQKLVVIRNGVETTRDAMLPGIEFQNLFGLYGAFGPSPLALGQTVYMPYPRWQLPALISQRTYVVAWTLTSVKGQIAELRGAVVDWDARSRDIGQPAPARPGEEMVSSGRLLIDLKQRRPVSLTLDVRFHLRYTDPLGNAQDTMTNVEWRGRR